MIFPYPKDKSGARKLKEKQPRIQRSFSPFFPAMAGYFSCAINDRFPGSPLDKLDTSLQAKLQFVPYPDCVNVPIGTVISNSSDSQARNRRRCFGINGNDTDRY